jgi:uracil-DNA glycosylase family protein
MKLVRLSDGHDYLAWRAAARALLLEGTPPGEVRWVEGEADLLSVGEGAAPAVAGRAVGVVPQRFVDLSKVALFHADPARFGLLYRLLFRLQKDATLLASRSDPDVARLYKLCTDVRETERREREARNHPEPMPVPPREETAMDETFEEITSLAAARAAIEGCTRCPLFEHATQAVFGEGPAHAEVMFVGEQPGDQEDVSGKPFVGPAGQVLDGALERVGIDRTRVYVTNAVKHFKYEPRGKKRIHQKPNAGEISACRFWLDLERRLVRPKLVVALGATAAQALLGKATAVKAVRGKKLELPDGANLMVTVHPSYLLRIPEADRKAEELRRFEADLRGVKAYIDRRGEGARGATQAA